MTFAENLTDWEIKVLEQSRFVCSAQAIEDCAATVGSNGTRCIPSTEGIRCIEAGDKTPLCPLNPCFEDAPCFEEPGSTAGFRCECPVGTLGSNCRPAKLLIDSQLTTPQARVIEHAGEDLDGSADTIVPERTQVLTIVLPIVLVLVLLLALLLVCCCCRDRWCVSCCANGSTAHAAHIGAAYPNPAYNAYSSSAVVRQSTQPTNNNMRGGAILNATYDGLSPGLESGSHGLSLNNQTYQEKPAETARDGDESSASHGFATSNGTYEGLQAADSDDSDNGDLDI